MANVEKIVYRVLGAAVLIALIVLAIHVAQIIVVGGRTIFDLLSENKKLRQAIGNLTAESTIGYAQVLRKETRDGATYTTIRFIETQRDDLSKKLLETEFTVPGDEVHFDALVVRFGQEYVADGRKRALYLWRRVYSDKMRPEEGFPIEQIGEQPARYREIFSVLKPGDSRLFWKEIWALADDAQRLKAAGVEAVHGKEVYIRMNPGILYSLRISNTGDMNISQAPIPAAQ